MELETIIVNYSKIEDLSSVSEIFPDLRKT
jgi:hypothetical protein